MKRFISENVPFCDEEKVLHGYLQLGEKKKEKIKTFSPRDEECAGAFTDALRCRRASAATKFIMAAENIRSEIFARLQNHLEKSKNGVRERMACETFFFFFGQPSHVHTVEN